MVARCVTSTTVLDTLRRDREVDRRRQRDLGEGKSKKARWSSDSAPKVLAGRCRGGCALRRRFRGGAERDGAAVGPSGSGKATLLNCLSGLDRFDTGRSGWTVEPSHYRGPRSNHVQDAVDGFRLGRNRRGGQRMARWRHWGWPTRRPPSGSALRRRAEANRRRPSPCAQSGGGHQVTRSGRASSRCGCCREGGHAQNYQERGRRDRPWDAHSGRRLPRVEETAAATRPTTSGGAQRGGEGQSIGPTHG